MFKYIDFWSSTDFSEKVQWKIRFCWMKQMTLRSLCNFAGYVSLRNVVYLDKIESFNEERNLDIMQPLMFLSKKARIPIVLQNLGPNLKRYEVQRQNARWNWILYLDYVFLVDIKMGTKFFIFCKTLPVSDVCPNCQKNQPISVVEEIIVIYFL